MCEAPFEVGPPPPACNGLKSRALITRQVSLHDDASFGVSVEIMFQRANLPTHGANRFDSHSIHVGWNAAQEKRGTHEVTRDQITKDMFVPRHPHFPADNQRDTLDTFAMLRSVARRSPQ